MKRFLGIFLIFCLLAGHIPALAATVNQNPSDVLTDREMDHKYENLALAAKTVTASFRDTTGADQTNPNISTKRLIDGDLNTYYDTPATVITYGVSKFGTIDLQFDTAITFNKVVFYDVYRSILQFTLQTSDNGTDWTDIYTYDKDVIKELFYCYFKPVTAKYLRLNIQKIGNTTESSYYGIRIAELEIYHVSPVEF